MSRRQRIDLKTVNKQRAEEGLSPVTSIADARAYIEQSQPSKPVGRSASPGASTVASADSISFEAGQIEALQKHIQELHSKIVRLEVKAETAATEKEKLEAHIERLKAQVADLSAQSELAEKLPVEAVAKLEKNYSAAMEMVNEYKQMYDRLCTQLAVVPQLKDKLVQQKSAATIQGWFRKGQIRKLKAELAQQKEMTEQAQTLVMTTATSWSLSAAFANVASTVFGKVSGVFSGCSRPARPAIQGEAKGPKVKAG